MHIIHLDAGAIDIGRAAFKEYLTATVCGPAAEEYLVGLSRTKGLRSVAGAIIACIEHGITNREAIICAVCRVSHCRRATVRTFAVVMFCAMDHGHTNAASLHRYLQARGCPFDREAIDFLLTAFEGDDPRRHLWARDCLGAYRPLYPAPDGENFTDFL